ncbi:MAG TPA: ABC transporter permease [Gemmatimonadaceae bacterium]|nr:ABC transporter permease [Gemmatimonadaceae bacterium]
MDTIRRDLRYAFRTLARAPGFAAATILTLALGIGATTAIFSVVHGVLLRPLPYPDSDRIVQLWQVSPTGGRSSVSDPNFADWKEQSRSFSAMAQLATGGDVSVTGAGEPLRVPAARVSSEFLAVLGVQPVIGRGFVAEEQRLGGAPAVLVSHRFWQQHLEGAVDLGERTLTFGDRVHHIVGVLPPTFDFPAEVDLLTPRELDPVLPSRTAHNFRVIGRLRADVSLEQARAEMSAISRRLRVQHGDDTWMVDAAVVPLREQLVGRVRPALLVLLGASAFLLLIACANVTNLILARAASRQRELAVRVAMGAGRARLVQQFLAESFVLALAGGAVGILLAWAGVRLLPALEPGNLPRLGEIGVSWPVLAFAFGTSAVVATVIALLTALRGTAGDVREALAQSQRTMSGGGGHRVRSGLVVAQVALTLVLLVGAGLLGRSFMHLVALDPGYRTERAVVLELSLPRSGDAGTLVRQTRLYDELIQRFRSFPGVTAVGGVSAFPLGGGYANGAFLVMTRPDEEIAWERVGELMRDPARTGYAEYRIASDGYFSAMGMRLVRGRLFEESDGPDAPHVAVISESLARTRWPDENPIGKFIQFGNMDGDLRVFTIVGVVSDIREASLDAQPASIFYGSHRQRPRFASRFTLVVATTGDAAGLIAPARQVVRDLAPTLPPRFRLIEEVVSASIADRRFTLLLVGVFGVTALVLAMLGVYSVVSILVAQREQEIGIRVALGAQRSDVMGLVLRHGTALTALGVLTGVAAALALTRVLRNLLFGVSATDPLAFLGVVMVLVAVTLVASWVPARRATRVDPMTVLRNG